MQPFSEYLGGLVTSSPKKKMPRIPTSESFETPRTPSCLARFVAEILADIRADDQAKKSARLWKDNAKYLIREIFPLSIFARHRWPDDSVTVAPKIGNQGYDATVTDLATGRVTHVEVSWPIIYGAGEKKDAHDLNLRGRTDIHTFAPDERHNEVLDRLLKAAACKAQNDYSGAILLFVLDVWPSFYLDNPQHTQRIDSFCQELRTMEFKADEVYLVMMPSDYVEQKGMSPVLKIKR